MKLCLLCGVIGLIVINGLYPSLQASGAETNAHAAVLTITYPGVEILRSQTQAWFPLPVNAELPFGGGDAIRTDWRGRALISFSPAVQMILLPESTFTLSELSQDTDGNNLELGAQLEGHGIQLIKPAIRVKRYHLETKRLTVEKPANAFAIWTEGDTASFVTIADGIADITAGDEKLSIQAGQGVRVTPPNKPVIEELAAPLSVARLIGKLDGCDGQMQTPSKANVNIRFGPGFSYTVIGSIANDEPVKVMGINAAGTWYRIQAFSGFGWSQRFLVKNDCQELPVLPNDSVENNRAVFSVQPTELDLLKPFYGVPESDLWFYRNTSLEGR